MNVGDAVDFYHSVWVNPVSGCRDGDNQWHPATVTGFCCAELVIVRDEYGRLHIKHPAEIRPAGGASWATG